MFSVLFVAIVSVWCCCNSRWILYRSLLNTTWISQARHLSLFTLHLEPLFSRVDECNRLIVVVIFRPIFTTIARSMSTMFSMRTSRSAGASWQLTFVIWHSLATWTMTTSRSGIIRRLTFNRTWSLTMANGIRSITWRCWSHRLRWRRYSEQSTLLTFGPTGTSRATGWVRCWMAMMTVVFLNRIIVVEGCRNAICWSIQTIETVVRCFYTPSWVESSRHCVNCVMWNRVKEKIAIFQMKSPIICIKSMYCSLSTIQLPSGE